MKVDSLKDAKALGELLDALAKIEAQEEGLGERIEHLLPVEKYVLDYQTSMALERKIKKRARRKPGRPKLHWKEKKRREREQRASWYRKHQKPRDMEATLKSVEEGWYERVRLNWRKSKVPFRIEREEWEEKVAPLLEGKVPLVCRIRTKENVVLDNIVVYDRATGEVLFDGSEFRLTRLGYSLPSPKEECAQDEEPTPESGTSAR